jgi:hypothetical protein
LQHGPILSPKLRASNVSFGIGIAVTKKNGLAKMANLMLNERPEHKRP